MIYGLLIGIGIILPGVSGGVIAVILGVYDKILYALNNIKKDKKEAIFLIKIVMGIVIGSVISANLLKHFFNKHYVEMSYLFIGLILGTIPLLFQNFKEKSNEKLNYIVLIITILLSFTMSLIIKFNIITNSNSKILLLISGLLFAIGKIVPGVSSSVLLNLVGKYDLYLIIMSNPINYFLNNFFDTMIIIIGFLVGLFISLKLINYLLNRYYSITYSIILGFVIGSISVLYPKCINFPGIMFLLIGILFSLGIPTIKMNKK